MNHEVGGSIPTPITCFQNLTVRPPLRPLRPHKSKFLRWGLQEEPVLTAVPYNKHTTNPKLFCAASRLKSAWRKRRNSGANDSDCVFINQRSKFPLSTSVANKRIQSIMTAVFEEENKPTEWAKFYTLKSARKAVASLMKELGCSPQTIAIQLKHKTLDSQMHYIGKFYKDQPGLNRALYKDL